MDLGRGIGRVARYVAKCCRRFLAVDASERILSLARRRLEGLSNVKFARSEGTTVPSIDSERVDFVYSILTLQHGFDLTSLTAGVEIEVDCTRV